MVNTTEVTTMMAIAPPFNLVVLLLEAEEITAIGAREATQERGPPVVAKTAGQDE